MNDEKMVMLRDKTRWVRTLQKVENKGMSRQLYNMFNDYRNVLGLADLIEQGKYHPSIPRIVRIPKGNGKMRELTVLPDIDRVVFSVIADIYYDLYAHLFHHNCVSYKRGISVPGIVHEVCTKVKLGGFKADLTKFFDSVPRDILQWNLGILSTNSPVDTVVSEYYSTDKVYDGGVVIERYKSLSQGCAIAGILADLCLKDVDEKYSGIANVYLRYSDDILVLDRNSENILEQLKEDLESYGLEINPKKVSLIEANTTFEFLGTRINFQQTGIGDTPMQRLKSDIKAISKRYKVHNLSSMRNCIRSIQNKFFKPDKEGHRAFDYYCMLCNNSDTIHELDNYCKDTIRFVCTGKRVPKTNAKVDLKANGWTSLVYMFNLYNMDYNAYNIACNGISMNFYVPKSTEKNLTIEQVMEKLEHLWEDIEHWNGNINLFHQPQNAEDVPVLPEIAVASCKEVLSVLNHCNYDSGAPFVRSAKFPKICILQKWYA